MADDTSVPQEEDSKTVVSGNLQLDMPKPLFEPIQSTAKDDTAPEAAQDGTPSQEDLQTAIGLSISRAQTLMASATTPAAEKAAAMEGFDGMLERHAQDNEESTTPGPREAPDDDQNLPQTPCQSPKSSAELPSPWRSGPKTFERPQSKDSAEGFASMLPDVNLRRYMPTLPSLPKVSTFRDSVPSLGSILGTVRSHSPVRRGPGKRKRADTVVNDQGDKCISARDALLQSSTDRGRRNEGNGMRANSAVSLHQDTRGQGTIALRRSTSDQSLYLRNVTTSTSLGDDTRWESVSEQINSRAKAFRDSLQDSSLKRYSLANLNMPFRNRAQSGPKEYKNASHEIANAAPFSDRPHPSMQHQGINKIPESQPQSQSHLDNALDDLTGDLVILGGYRGSILRSAKPPHRQLWVPMKVGLNIRKVDLEIGLEDEDEEKMEESIYADGMLSHIGPVDMGRRLLKRLRNCPNAINGKLRIHEYGYDWRLSPHLLSRKVIDFLEKLPSNRPNMPKQDSGATVIAHSMGGLITRHAVNQRPELFAGVVYVGVPQQCVNILGPLRNGDDVLLSSKVLTAQTNFTMRSSFLLLPDDGHCFINKDTGEEYPVDFFSAEDWDHYAFSPCISTPDPAVPAERKSLLGSITDSLPSLPSLPFTARRQDPASPSTTTTATETAKKLADPIDPQLSSTPHPKLPSSSSASTSTSTSPSPTSTTLPRPLAHAYLTRTLTRTLHFRHALAHRPSLQSRNAYPPFALIYANNTPTVLAAKVSSRSAIRRTDAYDELKFGSGDGVVLAKAAMLPRGYVVERGGKVKSERGHVGLLGDLEAVGKAVGVVRRGRRGEGRGLGLDSGVGVGTRTRMGIEGGVLGTETGTGKEADA